jgi:hypothetical protein
VWPPRSPEQRLILKHYGNEPIPCRLTSISWKQYWPNASAKMHPTFNFDHSGLKSKVERKEEILTQMYLIRTKKLPKN